MFENNEEKINQNKPENLKLQKENLEKNQKYSPISNNSQYNLKINLIKESNKENFDFNKQYEITDNSQSAINPLNKSHDNLITSNTIINANDLFTAVEYNDLERVSELLKQEPSKINDLNEEGLSLLHIAVIKANIKMINLLISYGADTNILSEKKKQTPLHLAYLTQNSLTEEIIQELLKNKAEVSILDLDNKKPSDYIGSSYKKRQKKFNINEEYSDKKSYVNNITGNTVTLVTMDNHLDSFLTTNKEDEKSNLNNINSNNISKIQSPDKINIDYDYNEIVSINNSVVKNNNLQINQIDDNPINNNNNNNLENIDINNDYYFNIQKEEEKNDLNKNEVENIDLKDSLEENIKNEEKDEMAQSIDFLKTNKKIENKENIQNSINMNNNSMLTYTDSCIQSRNKLSSSKFNNEKSKNEKDNDELILKSPFNLEESQNKGEVNDLLLKKIIVKKRNSFIEHKNRTVIPSKVRTNKNIRNSTLDNLSPFDIEGNYIYENSLKSNKTNYISPLYLNYIKQNEKINNYNGPKTGPKFSGNISQFSTITQSHKLQNNYLADNIDKVKIINNNQKITEFHLIDSTTNNNNNTYNSIYSNENSDNNYRNISLLKYWLSTIGLSDYLENFTKNSIFDIDKLIERMKYYQTKLRFDDLERTLKIRTPGYVHRILCKLEADAGLIDPKIVKFMIREGGNEPKNIMIKNTKNNDLKLSVSQNYMPCLNCCRMNQIKKTKKNDLKYFLLRYDLINLYQNFYHNGFDMIEYVIVQMYTSSPINEDILENDFHIYNERQRKKTLKAIVSEMKKINKFLNSEEYNNSLDKNKIKYDNVVFEEDEYKELSKISIKKHNNQNQNEFECNIF